MVGNYPACITCKHKICSIKIKATLGFIVDNFMSEDTECRPAAEELQRQKKGGSK